MNDKFLILNLDTITRNDTYYSSKEIENAIKEVNKRNIIKDTFLKGELNPPADFHDFERWTRVEPNPSDNFVLEWKSVYIKDNNLYGILSDKTIEYLKKNYPDEEWEFTVRTLGVPIKIPNNDKINGHYTEFIQVRLIAIDKCRINSNINKKL